MLQQLFSCSTLCKETDGRQTSIRHRRSWFYMLFSSFFLNKEKRIVESTVATGFCTVRLMQMALKSDLRCDNLV